MTFICYLIFLYFNLSLSYILKSELSTHWYYLSDASYIKREGGGPFNLKEYTYAFNR